MRHDPHLRVKHIRHTTKPHTSPARAPRAAPLARHAACPTRLRPNRVSVLPSSIRLTELKASYSATITIQPQGTSPRRAANVLWPPPFDSTTGILFVASFLSRISPHILPPEMSNPSPFFGRATTHLQTRWSVATAPQYYPPGQQSSKPRCLTLSRHRIRLLPYGGPCSLSATARSSRLLVSNTACRK